MSEPSTLDPSESDEDDDDLHPRPPGKRRRPSLAASRHLGRTIVLQALYEADTAGHDPARTVERLLEDASATGEAAAFARVLIAGVKEARRALDNFIHTSAPQWPVEQLAVVDRNVLRIAIYELLFGADTPLRVAVNEAVELAKEYGSDASPRFVNGVLGAISEQHGDRLGGE